MLSNFYLVYFSTRVLETSNTSARRVLWEKQAWDTNDTSATQIKILFLITARVKTYFHIPILALWQVKDYEERNNFILRTTF